MDANDTREVISTLVDGQIAGDATDAAVGLAASDSAGRETWFCYHLIGDALRSADLAIGTAPEAFVARLRDRLAASDAGAPVPEESAAALVRAQVHEGRIATAMRPAANDANMRWKAVAGVACAAAVAALSWSFSGGRGADQPQLAAAPVPQSVPAQQPQVEIAGGGAMIRDPRLDEFLAAHRQLGGASALQMPAGFLRNVTFEGPAR